MFPGDACWAGGCWSFQNEFLHLSWRPDGCRINSHTRTRPSARASSSRRRSLYVVASRPLFLLSSLEQPFVCVDCSNICLQNSSATTMGGVSTFDTSGTPGFFRVAGKQFPNITWYKRKNLRSLYFLMFFVILTSATNGYDGSMVNGLLSLEQFKGCTFFATIA
jgi:hypothetical protein